MDKRANNKGTKGNKGGGRKSHYQEKADATFLWDIFTKDYTEEELLEIQSKETNSIRKTWIRQLLNGNERFIGQMVHKLFPDKQELGGMDGEKLDLGLTINNAIDKTYGETEPKSD